MSQISKADWFRAVRNGDVARARTMLEQQPSALFYHGTLCVGSNKRFESTSALQVSVHYKNHDFLRYLLSLPQLLPAHLHGYHALESVTIAIKNGDIKCIDAFLKAGLPINIQCPISGWDGAVSGPLLFVAYTEKNMEVIKYLILIGADLIQRPITKWGTPGFFTCLDYLIGDSSTRDFTNSALRRRWITVYDTTAHSDYN